MWNRQESFLVYRDWAGVNFLGNALQRGENWDLGIQAPGV